MKNLLLSTLCLMAVAHMAIPANAQPGRSVVSVDTSDRPQIDVESYTVDLKIVPEELAIEGIAEIRFRQLDRQSFATFEIDRRLRVTSVELGAEPVRYRQFDLDSTVEVELGGAQFTENPTLKITYAGTLDPNEEQRDPVLARVSDEAAFLLYDARWFPTNGLHKDPAAMRLRVTAPAGWTVVSDLPAAGDGSFASETPSYWGMVAAGNYTSTSANIGPTEISTHTLRADSAAVTTLAETAGEILDTYTELFGPAASQQFRIIEVQGANWTSRWSVGTLLLPTSQFRPDFDISALAQSLAHQWFPLKVAVEDPARDAWLVDGMSLFASLLYFEKTLAPAEAQEHVEKALVKSLGYEGDTTIVQAGGLEKDSAEYRALVQYKGGFVLRMLRWVVGDEKFNQIVTQYIERFQNRPASTEAFVELASNVAGEDLTYFFDQWLYSSGVPEFDRTYLVYRTPDGYKIVGQIKQDLDLFRMPLELQIETDGEPEYKRVLVSGAASEFEVMTERKPKQIIIDPLKKTLRMSPDIRVAVLINRGEEAANEGRYNDAVDEYQAALDIDANNSLADFRMGEALFELGNIQAAANAFRKSLNGDLRPKWVEVWAYINVGKIFDMRGDRERALAEYQKALNTGDDAYGAQGEAQKFIDAPFRRSGRTTLG